MLSITKNALLVFVATACFAACKNSASGNTEAADTSETVIDSTTVLEPATTNIFSELHTYLHGQDSTYAITHYTGGEVSMNDQTPAQPLDDSLLKEYKPLLKFNSDSSYAIDAITANYIPTLKNGQLVWEDGGPDFEIALLNFHKGERQRILFLGASQIFLEAAWQDAHTIVIATAEDMGNGKIVPEIWRYHTGKKSYEHFRYEGQVTADVGDFSKKNLAVPAAKTIRVF